MSRIRKLQTLTNFVNLHAVDLFYMLHVQQVRVHELHVLQVQAHVHVHIHNIQLNFNPQFLRMQLSMISQSSTAILFFLLEIFFHI